MSRQPQTCTENTEGPVPDVVWQRVETGVAVHLRDPQVEHMNRALKHATMRRYHYGSHDGLRAHPRLFLDAYNHARRLNASRGLPLRVHLSGLDKEAERSGIDPPHHTLG